LKKEKNVYLDNIFKNQNELTLLPNTKRNFLINKEIQLTQKIVDNQSDKELTLTKLKPPIEKQVVDFEETNLKKLDYRSQFIQRNQIKKIKSFLLQKKVEIQAKTKGTYTMLRKPRKSITEIEGLKNYEKQISERAQKSNNIVANIQKNSLTDSPIAKRRSNQTNTFANDISIQKQQIKKKNTFRLFTDNEFMQQSVDFDELLFKKTVNLGNHNVEEYYEMMDENPVFKTNEAAPRNSFFHSKSINQFAQLSASKYRTLNNDFEDMAKTDFAIERILLRFDKFWLSFPRKQNEETIEEFHDVIFSKYALFSKGNLFIYSVFNLFVSLLWILIHKNLNGFNGFFSGRIIVLSIAVILAEFWTKEFPKKYHKALVLIYYGFITIQILVFTIINPSVEIAMELEFLACYLSLTRYAFISFVDSIFISLIFLVLHIIYLNIIYNGTFLMLHSTFVVILFNLVWVHFQRKTQIDNFNNSRINVIKKKQLNNLIVNLLPNHVSFIKF